GRFRIRLDRKTVDFRVSILPSAFGEVVVVRILDKEYIAAGVAALRLDRLGFNAEDLRRFRRSITEPYGMVLVTGPTGSGKTTSLYAAISGWCGRSVQPAGKRSGWIARRPRSRSSTMTSIVRSRCPRAVGASTATGPGIAVVNASPSSWTSRMRSRK